MVDCVGEKDDDFEGTFEPMSRDSRVTETRIHMTARVGNRIGAPAMYHTASRSRPLGSKSPDEHVKEFRESNNRKRSTGPICSDIIVTVYGREREEVVEDQIIEQTEFEP